MHRSVHRGSIRRPPVPSRNLRLCKGLRMIAGFKAQNMDKSVNALIRPLHKLHRPC